MVATIITALDDENSALRGRISWSPSDWDSDYQFTSSPIASIVSPYMTENFPDRFQDFILTWSLYIVLRRLAKNVSKFKAPVPKYNLGSVCFFKDRSVSLDTFLNFSSQYMGAFITRSSYPTGSYPGPPALTTPVTSPTYYYAFIPAAAADYYPISALTFADSFAIFLTGGLNEDSVIIADFEGRLGVDIDETASVSTYV